VRPLSSSRTQETRQLEGGAGHSGLATSEEVTHLKINELALLGHDRLMFKNVPLTLLGMLQHTVSDENRFGLLSCL
jgi:hypothetical protein